MAPFFHGGSGGDFFFYGGLLRGEDAADLGAFVEFGVEFDGAAHGGDGVFDDGEAQAGAAVGAAAGTVDGVEAFEDSLLVFERDAAAGIGDFDDDGGGIVGRGSWFVVRGLGVVGRGPWFVGR